jgi:hypothetical protein
MMIEAPLSSMHPNSKRNINRKENERTKVKKRNST